MQALLQYMVLIYMYQIHLAFAPTMKRRVYVRRLVEIVSCNYCSKLGTLNTTARWQHDMSLSISRAISAQTSIRELQKNTNKQTSGLLVCAWYKRWCCPLHHSFSTAFGSKGRNHRTSCWILSNAGLDGWSPQVVLNFLLACLVVFS